jgi:hypothetical protein
MRAPLTNQPTYPATRLAPPPSTQNADTYLSTSSSLSITLALQSKREPYVKHRPVERPDGVIVEQPRYRPSTPIAPLRCHDFNPRALSLQLPKPPKRWRVKQNRSKKEGDHAHGLKLCGEAEGDVGISRRNTYSGPLDVNVTHRNVVMERFLTEDGPWTSYSRGTG